jgi:hypothetical protein
MKRVSLLLASVGIVGLATGGAVAQTVDYVQACSLYGSGFFYVPGSNVCLNFGGYARAEADFVWNAGRDWRVTGTLHPEFDARTETSHGTLRAFLALTLQGTVTGGAGGSATSVSFPSGRGGDEAFQAFVAFDPLLVGWATSTYDFSEAYTYVEGHQSDATPLQARLSWLMGGYTVSAALENPRDRDIASNFPAAVFAISPTATWGFLGSTAITDTPYGFGAAAQFGIEVPVLVNASVRAVGAVALNAQSYVGLDGAAPGFAWSGTVSGRFALNTGLNVVASLSVADGPTSPTVWHVVGGVHVSPTQHVELGGELFHRRWSGAAENGLLLRAQYNF